MAAFNTIDINSIIKGAEEVVGILKDLPKELEKCGDLGRDHDRLVEWAGIFFNPLELTA